MSRLAASPKLRPFLPAAVAAYALGLAACGTDGGTSSFLTPGPPTSAPPGDTVIYAAMALGDRIDAYRLGTDGLMPARPFDTIFVENPRRLTVANGVLYASIFDRIISIELGADGSMPISPTSESVTLDGYDPVELVERDGILYVAASGTGTVHSYVLKEDGSLPVDPTGAGTGEFAADYSTLALNDGFLYAASRRSEAIDVFILEADGNVPAAAELQDPQDRISLPDDMEIRDGVLYVTSSGDRSVRAYRIGPNGFLEGEEDSRTASEDYYSGLLLDGDTLYASAYSSGRIDLYAIDDDGMLPEVEPFRRTQEDPASYPADLLMHGGILYVAQAGLDRVDAFVLDGEGLPPAFPTSSTRPQGDGESFPIDIAVHELD